MSEFDAQPFGSTDTGSGVAIVTGAAGGIGAAVVSALAHAGARVAALDNDGAALAACTAPLRAAGYDVSEHRVDVTSSRSVDEVVDEVETSRGPVDRLVNAAGVLRVGTVADCADDDWAQIFAVNTTGVFHVSRAVVRRMVPRRRGAIVSVASNAATTPRLGMAAYAASKAAAMMFTKSLGLEVARYGIRCNLVAPGSTDTPMLRAMWPDGAWVDGSVDGNADAFKPGIPLGKIAAPDDVADAVLFLLSDRAGHITLHDLVVDGGATLGR